jgi:hypothetical protein
MAIVQTCAAADVCCASFLADCGAWLGTILHPVSESSVVPAEVYCSVMSGGRSLVEATVSGVLWEIPGAVESVPEAVVRVP